MDVMRRILSCLKTTHFILPLASLALVTAWNIHQSRSISSLRKESSELEKKIASVTVVSNQENGIAKGPGRESSAKDAINQKRPALGLSDRLAEMSRDEIIASLDEIDDLDLSDEEREALIEEMIDSLIEKDPQYALEHLGDKIKDDPDGIGSQLAAAMSAWAKRDLAAATAWLDRKIAAGDFDTKTLDGKSDVREEFEAALLESLIEKNPDAAAGRLAAIPEDQRRDVLEYLSFGELSSEAQKSYAGLLRQLIPEDERAGSFAHLASELANQGDYSKVDQFLGSVSATPEERVAAVRQAAESAVASLGREGKVNRESVDQLRNWITRQAPGKADEFTGRAIGEATQKFGKLNYDDAVKLVLDYHKSSKNDDLLESFLNTFSRHSNADKVIPLLRYIRNAELHDKFEQRYQ
jgi:hypothetical protein